MACSLALCWHASFLGSQLWELHQGGSAHKRRGHSSKSGRGSVGRLEMVERILALFERALSVPNPHPLVLGSLAVFLHKGAANEKRAETIFKQAVEAWPDHAST